MTAEKIYKKAEALAGDGNGVRLSTLPSDSRPFITDTVNTALSELKEKQVETSLDEIPEKQGLYDLLILRTAMQIAFFRRDFAVHNYLSNMYNAKRTAYLSSVSSVTDLLPEAES